MLSKTHSLGLTKPWTHHKNRLQLVLEALLWWVVMQQSVNRTHFKKSLSSSKFPGQGQLHISVFQIRKPWHRCSGHGHLEQPSSFCSDVENHSQRGEALSTIVPTDCAPAQPSLQHYVRQPAVSSFTLVETAGAILYSWWVGYGFYKALWQLCTHS